MAVSYKVPYLDRLHRLDQEIRRWYHFLKREYSFSVVFFDYKLSSVINGIDVPERLSDVVHSVSKLIALIFNEQSIAALSVKYRSCR